MSLLQSIGPNTKVILLLGDTGVGKSSFTNFLHGQHTDGIQIAEVSSKTESCTKIPSPYRIPNHPIYGDILLIDTPGFNDTSNEISNLEILKRIFLLFFNNGMQYSVHGLIYFTKASESRIRFVKDIDLFCKFFNVDRGTISKSSISIVTRWEDLKEKAKKKYEETVIQEIVDKFKLPVVRWDSEEPVDGQELDLNKLIRSRLRFELNLSTFDAEIKELSADLMEKDKKMEIKDITEHKTENGSQSLLHDEDNSSAGVFTIFTFGLSKLIDRFHAKKFVIQPSFPDGCVNRSIRILSHKVEGSDAVSDHWLEFNDEGSGILSAKSKIKFAASMFGHAKINYSLEYEIQYDISIPEASFSYPHEKPHYDKLAKDLFVSTFSKIQSEVSNAVQTPSIKSQAEQMTLAIATKAWKKISSWSFY